MIRDWFQKDARHPEGFSSPMLLLSTVIGFIVDIFCFFPGRCEYDIGEVVGLIVTTFLLVAAEDPPIGVAVLVVVLLVVTSGSNACCCFC